MWPIKQAPVLRVGLTPDGVVLRYPSPAAAVAEVAIAGDIPSGADAWRPALAELALLLQAPACRGAQVRISLSHRLTRFFGVPWSDDLMSAGRCDDYLLRHFKDLYGDSSEPWRFALEDDGRAQPRNVCAVPVALEKAIERACAAASARLEWLGPWIAPALDQGRKARAERDGWFAAVEPGCIALAQLERGQVRRVTSQPSGLDWVAELSRQVKRASLREALPENLPIWVVSLLPATTDLPASFELQSKPAPGTTFSAQMAGVLP